MAASEIRHPPASRAGRRLRERYWSPVNSPVLDAGGNVQFIIHRVEDVTELVRLKRREDDQGKVADETPRRADRIEAELFLTERQLAESQRLMRERQEMESEARSQRGALLSCICPGPIGMVLLTPAGIITELYQAYLDTLGYSREELDSHDSSFFTHPEDIPVTRNFFESPAIWPSQHGQYRKALFPQERRTSLGPRQPPCAATISEGPPR